MTSTKTLAAAALALIASLSTAPSGYGRDAGRNGAPPAAAASLAAAEIAPLAAVAAAPSVAGPQFMKPEFPPPGVAGEWTKDYKAAVERATSERKPLVLYFSPIWCHYCRVLESQILPTPEFAAIAKDAIFVWLDPDLMGDGYSLSKSMKVKSYPSVVVMHAGAERVKELKRVTGVYPRKDYVARFGKAMKSWANEAKKSR